MHSFKLYQSRTGRWGVPEVCDMNQRFCSKFGQATFFVGFQPWRANLSRARLRARWPSRPSASAFAFLNIASSSAGLWRVDLRAALRPRRRRQIPHERVRAKQKYFTRSGVSRVIAPMRGNNRNRLDPIRQRNPCTARFSMCFRRKPTHSCRMSSYEWVIEHICIRCRSIRSYN